MYLVITLRKEVPDVQTAEALHVLVKEKLADHPEIVITGHVTENLDIIEEPA